MIVRLISGLVILSLFFNSCKNYHEDVNIHGESGYEKKNFDSLILAVDSLIGNKLTYNNEMIKLAPFRELYEHGKWYFPDAIVFIKTRPFSEQQISICLYAMQNLNVKLYVALCRVYMEAYKQHKIVEPILSSAIMPNFMGKRIIIKNYEDEDVVELLNEILRIKDISPDFKGRIQHILSGKYARELKDDESTDR